MKRNDSIVNKSILFLISFLAFLPHTYITAQCPTITVLASASQTMFCAGSNSQLSVATGISGGGYSVVQIPFAPTVGSGTAVTLTDDQVSTLLPIGFNFTFFGNVYSQFNICSNGFISFNPTNSYVYSLTMPAVSPNTIIAAALEDLNPPLGGTIEYFNVGSAPNRKLIVNYSNIQHYPSGNPITLQIVLSETYNTIQIHTTSVLGPTATEGIADSTGMNFLVVPGRNNQAWTATNDAWQFSPGNPVLSYQWLPTNGLSNPSINNPYASPTSTTTYTVTATDTNGCYGTSSLTLYVNSPQISLSASPDSVCFGNSTQLSAAVTTNSIDNYSVAQIAYAPVSFTGMTVALSDDHVSAAQPIGFTFGFYENYYSNFYISSNGFITFDPIASANNMQGCCSGQLIPNNNLPNNLIAGAWEDLNPSGGGTVQYTTLGIAPNRKLVVSFTGIPHSPSVDPVTFQIICYETSNSIEIHTTSMPGNPSGYWWGHTEGIENSTGTLALSVPGRNNDHTWTATQDAYRYTPTSTIHYIWSPITTLSNDSISNPIATPINNTIYSLTAIDASGCFQTSTIPIVVNPLPTAPVISYPGFVLHSNYPNGNQWFLNGSYLLVGATGQNFVPGVLGTYTVVYTDANGCSSTSAPFNVTQLGIDNYEQNILATVLPNPFTNELHIAIDNNLNSEVVIYDISSRKVISKEFTNKLVLNTEMLANGFYTFALYSNKQLVKTGKLNKP